MGLERETRVRPGRIWTLPCARMEAIAGLRARVRFVFQKTSHSVEEECGEWGGVQGSMEVTSQSEGSLEIQVRQGGGLNQDTG